MKQISDIFGFFPTEVISLIRGSIHPNDILFKIYKNNHTRDNRRGTSVIKLIL